MPRFPLPCSGKSKWGLSNGGLKATLSAICAQSSAIMHICGLLLRDFSSQNDDNCRQSSAIVHICGLLLRDFSSQNDDNCRQSSAIVHICGLLLMDFSSQNDDNCSGKLWTSTSSPDLLSPHVDFPDACALAALGIIRSRPIFPWEGKLCSKRCLSEPFAIGPVQFTCHPHPPPLKNAF